jgi:hypothetical protein
MKCLICEKETSYRTAKTCSEKCKNELWAKRHNEKKLNDLGKDEYEKLAKCEICGMMGEDLTSHLTRKHKISVEEYRKKYGVDRIHSICYLERSSERFTGEKNPIHKIRDKREVSPYSYKFYMKRGYDETTSKKMAQEKSRELNENKTPEQCNCNFEYWLKKCKGDEKEARRKYKERQSTFSKKKCIEKYGEEKGLAIWEKRQKKWQSSLMSKPLEERIRINKAKLKAIRTCGKRGYSKISQELFVDIYARIKMKFSDIYFATLKGNGEILDDGNNNEYLIRVGAKYKLLDFYIPSMKKCIEFDGDYYHSEKFRKGNKERDKKREEEILEAHPEIKILHVTEREYKEDREEVIEKCLRFING